jgi:hypothetical protein
MRILIAFHSRSGHTARLADALAREMTSRGHEVVREAIQPVRTWNQWLLVIPLLPLLPCLPLYLAWAPFRRFWHAVYFQPEQAIRPLEHADVSGFDLVLLGTPKWLYMSYPAARWLRTVKGLSGRRVAPFATFCGPPLRVFEVEMLFEPLDALIRRRGGEVAGRLHVSSAHHPFFWFGEMAHLFRWISRKAFQRPLADFTLDGEIGQAEVQRFCNALARQVTDAEQP